MGKCNYILLWNMGYFVQYLHCIQKMYMVQLTSNYFYLGRMGDLLLQITQK